MEHKDVPITHVKAEDDEGRFSAIAAVWDVVDRVGDRMKSGAFAETLRRWRESGKRIPIVWSHQTNSPDTVIGSADPRDVRETPRGLLVDGVLDIVDNPTAKRVFSLLKNGSVSGWSFGYLTQRERRRNGANEILEVELLELGPTVSPANPATATVGVKGLSDLVGVKAWDGSASRFDDAEYAASCIVDRADCSEEWRDRPAKERFSVPIRDPGAERPNPDALGPAAAALAGGRTPLADVCSEAISAATRRLLAAYRELDMDPPESLQETEEAIKAAAPIRIASFEVG